MLFLFYLPFSAQKNVKMRGKAPRLPEFIKKDIEQYKSGDPKRSFQPRVPVSARSTFSRELTVSSKQETVNLLLYLFSFLTLYL
jgi:hypothetical protein